MIFAGKSRLYLVFGLGFALFLVLILLFVLRPGGKTLPAILGTPTPSPSAALENSAEDEAYEQGISKDAEQPIARALPHYTPYWNLQFKGIDAKGKYMLLATILVRDSRADRQAAINKQKPFILAFLKSIHQPTDSYVIRYTSALVQSD